LAIHARESWFFHLPNSEELATGFEEEFFVKEAVVDQPQAAKWFSVQARSDRS
jgi:hypothetical protein